MEYHTISIPYRGSVLTWDEVDITDEIRDKAYEIGKLRYDQAQRLGRTRMLNEGKSTVFEMHFQGAYCDYLVPLMYKNVKLAQPLYIPDGGCTHGNDFIIMGKEFEGKVNMLKTIIDAYTLFVNIQKHQTAMKRGAYGFLSTSINNPSDIADKFRVCGWVPIKDIPSYPISNKHASPHYLVPFNELQRPYWQ